MEMHQVRYFLSVARTLNFTRAAEECNVSQPALTRAIRHLEEELCGELLRREGKLSHLTELGQRMLPLMQQCYESALAAKSLASALKTGTAQPLSLGLSHTVDMRLLTPVLAELQRTFAGLQLKVVRGQAGEIVEALQKGRVEFAVAAPLLETWDRLDAWLLFEERFELVTHREHLFGNTEVIDVAELADELFLVAEDSESQQALADALNEHNVPITGHQIAWSPDLIAFLEANLGIAFLPQSASLHPDLRRIRVKDLQLSRKISLYGVAGRQRSPAGDALMKLLRARDWASAVA